MESGKITVRTIVIVAATLICASALFVSCGDTYDKISERELEVSTAITITFNSNGGSGTMDPQIVPQSHSVNLHTNTFTRSGYTFNFWSSSPMGGGTYEYNDGQNFDADWVNNQDLTLYAQWN